MTNDKYTDSAIAVREGEELDLTALANYLQAKIPEMSGDLLVKQFPSGFSNLTYLLSVSDKDYVLRRPPRGASARGGHDMSREFRMLKFLHERGMSVPQPIHLCEDVGVIGAEFFLMECINGFVLRNTTPAKMLPQAAQMTGMADGLIREFARLHQLMLNDEEIARLGRPEGYMSRQIGGWIQRYEKAKTDDIPAMDKIGLWMQAQIPDKENVGVIHNDYKYDNIIFSTGSESEILAILDWEMSTVGDPLMDLGTTLAYWVENGDPPELKQFGFNLSFLPGNPGREEFVSKYSALTSSSVDNVHFYYVYGLYKLAVIAQQIYFRYKKGYTTDERFAALIGGVRLCSIMASQALTKKRITNLFDS